MSAENQNHPADLAEIEALHTRYIDIIFGAGNDRLLEFQDKAYAMGRARGQQEAAQQHIPGSLEVFGWVSVSERLPAEDEHVLAYDGESSLIAWQHNSFWFGSGWSDSVLVTHWMPLPAAPGA